MMQEDSRRLSSTFPEVFPITLSHSEFPYSYNMASVDELGSPLGCIITPYIKRSDRTHLVMKTHPTIPISADVARCLNCQSYINPFCDISTIRWYCSLCSSKNVFPRKSQKSSQSQRYQRAGTGILPETQDILVDYPMPYREEIDGYIPKRYLGKTSIPSIDRPLVHIFVVQENMALDTMEAVIEGLTVTLQELHPDIQVVLMSYSNRIGIYRLSDEIGVPTVQYIHMATSNGQGKVFEGRDLQDLNEDGEGIQNVEVTTPLSNVISFKKAAKRLGDCRQTLEMAISSIFDSEPIKTDSIIPHNHIGPVLQAISDWVLKSPGEDIVFNNLDASESEMSALQTISNIKDITLNLLGLQSGRDRQSKESNRKDDNFRDAPVDSCSGVVLNLFISSQQDLPMGSHESVSMSNKKSNKLDENCQTEINRQWAEKLGEYFCKKSLSVNIWAITSFEGQEIGLWGLSPLANKTGGNVNRFVLGDYPKDERIRFAKMLSKVLKSPLATKCILKVRTSSLVEIDENGFIGHAISDDELPGIFRISSCSPDEGFAFYINFKHDALIQDDHPHQIQNKAAVLQVAFSYDTLVEEDKVLDNDNDNEEIDDNNDNIDKNYIKSISEILNVDVEVSDILPKKDDLTKGKPRQVILKEDGQYYNFSKRLVSVRRLRIITIMIECSPRMSRMVQVAHIPTIASLITRQAIMFNNGQKNEGELILGQTNLGAQLVVDWAISIVNSLVTVMYKNYLDANRMNQQAIPLNPAELVTDAVKHLQGNRCLQVLFGAFNIMSRTCLLDGYRSDSSVELSNLLERIDSYHSEIILYPCLFPINKDGNLEDKIPLRREAMITRSANSYLLDAGYEMVYYQNIPSSKLSPPLPQKSSVTSFESSKPVVPLPKWGPPTVILNDNKVQNTVVQSSLDVKEEKTLSEFKPSRLLLKIFQRVNLSYGIPHVYTSEAGTSSSRYLTSHLFEDSDYYNTFIEHISQQTLQDFKKNNKLK